MYEYDYELMIMTMYLRLCTNLIIYEFDNVRVWLFTSLTMYEFDYVRVWLCTYDYDYVLVWLGTYDFDYEFIGNLAIAFEVLFI